MLSLTRNMAVEYAGKNIRVNAINPGSIRTPMLMHFVGDDAETTDPTPMGRWGKPEEIADAALFLASDRASYITGAALNVDGGLMSFGTWGLEKVRGADRAMFDK